MLMALTVKLCNHMLIPLHALPRHGMLQRRTNIMDGAVVVTQRPIFPGESYVYNFIADTPGTFCKCGWALKYLGSVLQRRMCFDGMRVVPKATQSNSHL